MPRLAPVMSATFSRRWARAGAERRFVGKLATVSVINQGQEFSSGLLLVAEAAQHGRCDCGGVLLLHASHHHAEVAGFDDHTYALGLDRFLNGFRNLCGQALLNLEAARKNFDEAWNFAKADNFAVGNVRHVYLAEEGQHVMLAQAEYLDIFDDHHFVVADGEEGVLEHGVGILLVAFGKKLEGMVYAFGRAE